jgi:geranylgeranyl diphosphate synthase type II
VLQQFIDQEIMDNLHIRISEAINGLKSPTRERIRDFIISTKGKQLRPALIVMTTKILVEDTEHYEKAMERSYNAATAIELLHNMTLIHDDLIDGAPLRRGIEAFHVKYGLDRALHDGDVLHAYALTLLKKEPTLNLVLDYSYQVSLGNAIELEDRLDQNFDFDIDHIIEIMRLKTAIVFAGCVRLGCLAGNREDLFSNQLHEAIVAAGVAFQIQDDVLDILGDQDKFGKVPYWDIQESKRNLFLFFSLQTENAPKVKEIYNRAVGEKTDEDIHVILGIFRSVKDKVKEVRDRYLDFSLKELKKLQNELGNADLAAEELFDFLMILVKFLVEREK